MHHGIEAQALQGGLHCRLVLKVRLEKVETAVAQKPPRTRAAHGTPYLPTAAEHRLGGVRAYESGTSGKQYSHI